MDEAPRVLIAENETVVSAELELLLEERGIGPVMSVKSGADALEALSRHSFDIVITSFMLADGPAQAFLDRLAELSMPLIVVSGANPQAVRPALPARALFFAKPYGGELLEKAAELWRQRGS